MNKKNKTELCDIFYKYRSDKCPDIFHSYSPVYSEILSPYRDVFDRVMEVGIGTPGLMTSITGAGYITGASLYSWRDYFTKAVVIGLDIAPEALIEGERIECYYTDQSRESELEKTVSNINTKHGTDLSYDLILDDGSHIVEHMVLTFNVLRKYVKPGGFYIIEDIKSHELSFFEKLECGDFELVKSHPGTFAWDSFVCFKRKQ